MYVHATGCTLASILCVPGFVKKQLRIAERSPSAKPINGNDDGKPSERRLTHRHYHDLGDTLLKEKTLASLFLQRFCNVLEASKWCDEPCENFILPGQQHLDSHGVIRNAAAWAGGVKRTAPNVVSEHPQTFLNSLGPSGRGTEIVESRGSLSQLHVEVTVLRAHDIPHIKRQFSRKRRFFVTVTNLVTTKKTERVQIYGETVVWNQRLSAL
ncbi:hypothetical protein EDB85DRAFT_2282582 [Lactarius pseudohatsudake]|nr:hypothetical protein EDB85DRAFT_2282582 [Lactarius pseudohatsudake]